jgi:hypothetical protein
LSHSSSNNKSFTRAETRRLDEIYYKKENCGPGWQI